MKNKSKKELFYFASQIKGKPITFDFYTNKGQQVPHNEVKRETQGNRTKFVAYL